MESDPTAMVGCLSKGDLNLSSRRLGRALAAHASCSLVICGHLLSTYDAPRCLSVGKTVLRFIGATSESWCSSVPI